MNIRGNKIMNIHGLLSTLSEVQVAQIIKDSTCGKDFVAVLDVECLGNGKYGFLGFNKEQAAKCLDVGAEDYDSFAEFEEAEKKFVPSRKTVYVYLGIGGNINCASC